MSQVRKPYQVGGISKEIRSSTLAPFPDWEPPTPGEIRAALQMAGWSGEGFANALGINPRTVRRWIGGENDIAYAVWAVLCVDAGLGRVWSR